MGFVEIEDYMLGWKDGDDVEIMRKMFDDSSSITQSWLKSSSSLFVEWIVERYSFS